MDSDPEIEFIEKDSGMSSLGGSKDETPERRTTTTETKTVATSSGNADPDNLDDEPDETVSERLYGLTEMFPDPVRNFTGKVTDLTVTGIKGLYSFSCQAAWILFTSSVILFAPVIFETERAQMEEMQKTQQKQVLLGPGSAMSAGGVPAMPPIVR